jgi:hypothetical protein
MNPNIADFYQHQDWNGVNGWEITGGSLTGGSVSATGMQLSGGTLGGWCQQAAYADIFYDLTTRGYTGLFAVTPTALNWETPIYGTTSGSNATTVQVQASDLYKLTQSMSGNVNQYLALTGNTGASVPSASGGTLTGLQSNYYLFSGGSLNYVAFTTSGTTTTTSLMPLSSGVATLTNDLLKDLNADVAYRLLGGSTTVLSATQTVTSLPGTITAVNRPQGRWWTNFHYVAVAGISLSSTLSNSTVYVADPDTNMGSGAANMGWPLGTYAGSFPFSSPASAPLPTGSNASFASFTFSGSTVSSTNAPQYNGTVLQLVSAVYAGAVSKTTTTAGIAPGDTKTDITLTLASDSNAVDGVLIVPSTLTDSSSGTFASDFSFTDDSNPLVTATYSTTASDPFGNTLANGGEKFMLSSGSALLPGQTADLDLGTSGSFTAGGYDVLLHFQGDPATEWVPEVMGASETVGLQYDLHIAVPEPSGAALLGVGLVTAAVIRRWRRRRARSAPS